MSSYVKWIHKKIKNKRQHNTTNSAILQNLWFLLLLLVFFFYLVSYCSVLMSSLNSVFSIHPIVRAMDRRSRLGIISFKYSISHFRVKLQHLECDSVWKTLERWCTSDLGDMLTLWLCGDLTIVMKTLNWDRCIWQSDNNAGTSQCCFLVPRNDDSFLINICIIK